MFFKFTDSCQKLFYLSLREKNKYNDDFIGTEHIFLALLKMSNHYICKIFNESNLFYENFSSFISKKNNKKDEFSFIYTPLMKDVLSNISKNRKGSIDISDIVVEILNIPNSRVNLILKNLSVDVKSILKSINVVSKKKSINNKSILNEIGVNLNNKCLNDDEVLLGREKELEMIIEILCCRNKNNPLLIGDAGVGKTAIVEELSRRIEKGNVPYQLRNKKIYSVSMSSLVAGTKYRGEFEEKINKLINEVENDDDIILFIDEIHTLIGAGGADGAIDASNILKPSLARGIIKIIGATTRDEYNKFFSNDKALSRRFRNVTIEEPGLSKTKDILLGIKNIYERYHNVVISERIIDLILNYSNKYIKNRKFPDKAIDILDEVSVLSSFSLKDSYNSIDKIDNEIKDIINKKNKVLLVGDYKKAIEYSFDEKKLLSKLGKEQEKLFKKAKKIEVDEKYLYQIMERKTNIPFYTYNFDYSKINDLFKKYKIESLFNTNTINKINSFTYNFYNNLINNIGNNRLYLYSNNEDKTSYFIKEYLNIFFSDVNKIYLDCNSIKNIDDLINNIVKVKDNCFSVLIINNYDNKNYLVNDFLDDIGKKGYFLDQSNIKVDFSNILIIYNRVSSGNKLGFVNSNKSNDNEIDVSLLSYTKIKNKVIEYFCNNNIKYQNKVINDICNHILNRCDNLDNLDFFIKNEIKVFKTLKNRTIKV